MTKEKFKKICKEIVIGATICAGATVVGTAVYKLVSSDQFKLMRLLSTYENDGDKSVYNSLLNAIEHGHRIEAGYCETGSNMESAINAITDKYLELGINEPIVSGMIVITKN